MISLCEEINGETLQLNASETLLSTLDLWQITKLSCSK